MIGKVKPLVEPFVTLEPVSHRYFDPNGNEYKSVSKLLESFKKKFDEQTMSWACAKKELRLEGRKDPTAAEIQLRQQAVLAKWKARNRESLDIGTEIHNAIEAFIKHGMQDGKFPFIPELCQKYFSDYGRDVFPETAIYSKKYFLSGTSDLPVKRSANMIDIFDYKTNASKGITYKSDYGNRMLGCLDHLEECSYNTYSLQLSIYAYMLEEHGYKIGRLALIFIPPACPEKHELIPVPYMKSEVINMLDFAAHYGVIKKQPLTITV